MREIKDILPTTIGFMIGQYYAIEKNKEKRKALRKEIMDTFDTLDATGL